MPLSHIIAWLSLILATICAVVILIDIRSRPQPMKVMSFVWPLCALFGGPFLLAFYYSWGRAPRSEEAAVAWSTHSLFSEIPHGKFSLKNLKLR